MRPELQKKIDYAIKLLRTMSEAYGDVIEVAYSGGKDSDVILQLTREAGIPYRAIYKCTTIDPPGTIKHVMDMGVEIMRPKESFFKIIEKKGFPTRRARFCCEVLKEYKVLDKAIIGVRREESSARAQRYKEPTICRVYSKTERTEQIMPILDWTLQDVTEFLQDRKIKCAPIYYDEQGVFHPERRLGCLGCPMRADNGRADFESHPKLVKAWLRAGRKFLETHPNSSCRKKFRNEYELFTHNVFFDTYTEFKEAVDGLFGTIDCKKFLEDHFKIKL